MQDSNWGLDVELDAVNDILEAIGESPVATLEEDGNTDVMTARRILQKINRREQAKGWTFNTDEEASLEPDAESGLIPYLPSYLRVIGSGGSPYINRGGWVYDRTTKTDEFTSAITVQLVALAGFEEMPEVFRSLIVAKAAKQFNMSMFGDPSIDTVLAQDIAELTMQVNEYELDYGAFNIFTTDPFVSGAIGR